MDLFFRSLAGAENARWTVSCSRAPLPPTVERDQCLAIIARHYSSVNVAGHCQECIIWKLILNINIYISLRHEGINWSSYGGNRQQSNEASWGSIFKNSNFQNVLWTNSDVSLKWWTYDSRRVCVCCTLPKQHVWFHCSSCPISVSRWTH